LDRVTLRDRVKQGLQLILGGLDNHNYNHQELLYQAIVAVEQTAARLSSWSPHGTSTVTAKLILSEGYISLLAHVHTHNHHRLDSTSNIGYAGTPIPNSPIRSQQPQPQQWSTSTFTHDTITASPNSKGNNNNTWLMQPQFYRSVSAPVDAHLTTKNNSSPQQPSFSPSSKSFAFTPSTPSSHLGGATILSHNNNTGSNTTGSASRIIGSVLNETNHELFATAPPFPPPPNITKPLQEQSRQPMSQYFFPTNTNTSLPSNPSSAATSPAKNHLPPNNGFPTNSNSHHPNQFFQRSPSSSLGVDDSKGNNNSILTTHNLSPDNYAPTIGSTSHNLSSPSSNVLGHRTHHDTNTITSNTNRTIITSNDNSKTHLISANVHNSEPLQHKRQGSEGPEPSTIVPTLLAMGFSQNQCEAAVQAIRNTPYHRRNSSIGSSTQQNHNHIQTGGNEMLFRQTSSFNDDSVTAPPSNQPSYTSKQLSGEDILGYVFNSGSQMISRDTSSIPASAGNNSVPGRVSHDATLTQHNSDNRNLNTHGSDQYLYHPTSSSSSMPNDMHSDNTWISSSSILHTDNQRASSSTTPSISQHDSRSGTVWGNPGKLKVVKSSSIAEGGTMMMTTTTMPGEHLHPHIIDPNNNNMDEVTVLSGESSILTNSNPSSSWTVPQPQLNQIQPQQPKVVKVLEIPPDLNAFVFHCNAQTRDECLDRGLFGCPSGGQYGPHSKAKAGDLLFLADFSAWTVTGIFTAKCDAALNIEKSAWAGKFPWQIRLNPWSTLRTVHIDKVNEIIGLASGSKLNMLTKDQLLQLVMSKEFAPCVPPNLYKMKPLVVSHPPSESIVPPPSSPTRSLQQKSTKPNTAASDEHVKSTSSTIVMGLNSGKKMTRTSNFLSNSCYDEHPATAMHRLKLITAWFDTIASEIMTMNELYNGKKLSKNDNAREKVTLDDNLMKYCRGDKADSWPLMTFSHIRKAVAQLFDQWLFQCHALNGEEASTLTKNAGNHVSESGSWIRQGKGNGKIFEDPVLLSQVPGSMEYIAEILQTTTGLYSLCVPSDSMAKALATKIVNDVADVATEVRKTQTSLIRIGGDDYLKSIEDKTLGMRLSEANATFYDDDGTKVDKAIMRIEWHTKSSISQGRPPQVQKIFKSHFKVLEKYYHEVTSQIDPDLSHMLTRIFVLLCRYDLVGEFSSNFQATVPLPALQAMIDNFAVVHECFSTPMNRTCSTFNSLFPDVDKYFGSIGSFFDFQPLEGSFEVNPPFSGISLKIIFDHIFTLLRQSDNDKNPLSFLVVVNQTEEILGYIENVNFLRRTVTVKNDMHRNNAARKSLNHKDTGPPSRKVSIKSSSIDEKVNEIDLNEVNDGIFHDSVLLIWLQNDFGYDLWTPSDSRVNAVIERFYSQ
jgi:hypothetical protein